MNIQRDINTIALDYLKITGAKDLAELEKNHKYFWQQYQAEIKRVGNSKKFVDANDITKANEITLKEVTELIKDKTVKEIKCNKCKKILFKYSIQFRFYITDENIDFMRTSESIKAKCNCGANYKFKKNEDNNFQEIKKPVQEKLM